jgi:hypothetical protein
MTYITKQHFKQQVLNAFKFMRENPSALEAPCVSMVDKLSAYMKSSGQGSANKVTNHEANIASVFEENGFSLAPRKSSPTDDGYYYVYQSGGSQKKGDFVLFWYVDGETCSKIVVDAKHSNSKSIYLNDGWFDEDTVYIISYNAGTKKFPKLECFIGMGQDIPTDLERAEMEELVKFKQQKNSEKNVVGFVRIYIRFANQYSCKRFTGDFTIDRFEKTLSWLEP